MAMKISVPNFFNGNAWVAKTVERLQQTVIETQIDLAIRTATSTDTRSNPYPDSREAILELVRKYDGEADYGCDQARAIVNTRAAFTIGNGLIIYAKDPVTGKRLEPGDKKFQAELDFINNFIKYNNLDEEGAVAYAREAELEGRILFKLLPKDDVKQIALRFVSYAQHGYKVVTDPDDYLKYDRAEYQYSKSEDSDTAVGTVNVKLSPESFVYKKFAGRVSKVNKLRPVTATLLKRLEAIDKAMSDLRKINNLFASPTPHFNCDSVAASDDLQRKLKDCNWAPGKAIVTHGCEFQMVEFTKSSADALVEEITMNCKIVSGDTGVPVSFLGMPDLMSNRAVSTDLFEMIIAMTETERKTWVGTYEELFKKTLELASGKYGKIFNPDCIGVDIPRITSAKLRELVDIWLPLFNSNVVDLDYMLKMVPDADPDKIKAAAKLEAQRELDAMKAAEAAASNQGAGQ
jgi:hypothetical protein